MKAVSDKPARLKLLDKYDAVVIGEIKTSRKVAAKLNNLSGLRDVFFIDIFEISDDLFEAEVYLREKVV